MKEELIIKVFREKKKNYTEYYSEITGKVDKDMAQYAIEKIVTEIEKEPIYKWWKKLFN